MANFNKVALFRLIFCIYHIYLIFIIYVLYSYWGLPEPYSYVIEGSSTNGIPSYLIIIQICFSLLYYDRFNKFNLYSPLFTFIVSLYGFGRGNIIISFLIFSISIIFSFVNSKYKYHSLLILIPLFLLLSHYLDLFSHFVLTKTKLSFGLIEHHRLNMLSDYINKLNPLTLLVGTDYTGTVIGSKYDNNPHISFIRCHSTFGLFYTIACFFSPLIILINKSLTNFKKFVFVSFSYAAILRALTEPILFPSFLDFFYFLPFFIYLRLRKNA